MTVKQSRWGVKLHAVKHVTASHVTVKEYKRDIVILRWIIQYICVCTRGVSQQQTKNVNTKTQQTIPVAVNNAASNVPHYSTLVSLTEKKQNKTHNFLV